jgi:hypothetical protein
MQGNAFKFFSITSRNEYNSTEAQIALNGNISAQGKSCNDKLSESKVLTNLFKTTSTGIETYRASNWYFRPAKSMSSLLSVRQKF